MKTLKVLGTVVIGAVVVSTINTLAGLPDMTFWQGVLNIVINGLYGISIYKSLK